MPARFLLIDGYNLLHAAGMGRASYGPGDLQRCRERLLRYLLLKLTRAEIDRATVVFDARDPPPDRPARQVVRGLTIVFANPGGDADVLIQNWLLEHSAPKRVTLVSSDRVLQRAARRRGAQFVDSERFFDRLEQRIPREPAAAAGDKPTNALSPAEAARWAQEFGDLSALSAATDDLPIESGDGPAPATASPPPPGQPGPKPRKRRPSGAREDTRKTSDDLAYWLDVFRDLPEAAELRRNSGNAHTELERWLAGLSDREKIDLSQINKKRDK